MIALGCGVITVIRAFAHVIEGYSVSRKCSRDLFHNPTYVPPLGFGALGQPRRCATAGVGCAQPTPPMCHRWGSAHGLAFG
jgi:hypothetical protein